MPKLQPRPQKNYPSYGWDHLDYTIQTILSDPLFKDINPARYSIPKDEIISECINAGYMNVKMVSWTFRDSLD